MAKIMLVDDAAFMRMMVKNALTKSGYDNFVAATHLMGQKRCRGTPRLPKNSFYLILLICFFYWKICSIPYCFLDNTMLQYVRDEFNAAHKIRGC